MLVQFTQENGVPAQASEDEVRDSSLTQKKSAGLRILVVDDEALVRWSIAETLTANGYEVSEAADGRAALERVVHAAAAPIDVVMLDYRLPDFGGLALLATLRQAAPGSQIILMTAFGTPEIEAEALQLGAYCMIRKPFDMRHVFDLVSQAHDSRPA